MFSKLTFRWFRKCFVFTFCIAKSRNRWFCKCSLCFSSLEIQMLIQCNCRLHEPSFLVSMRKLEKLSKHRSLLETTQKYCNEANDQELHVKKRERTCGQSAKKAGTALRGNPIVACRNTCFHPNVTPCEAVLPMLAPTQFVVSSSNSQNTHLTILWVSIRRSKKLCKIRLTFCEILPEFLSEYLILEC